MPRARGDVDGGVWGCALELTRALRCSEAAANRLVTNQRRRLGPHGLRDDNRQPMDVGIPAGLARPTQLERVSSREPSQRIWERARRRHLCPLYEGRNDPDAPLQRRLELDPDIVAWMVEPSCASGVPRVEPARADHRDDEVATRELRGYGLDEILAGANRRDVEEELDRGKELGELLAEQQCVAAAVDAPIADEDSPRSGNVSHQPGPSPLDLPLPARR